MRGEGRVDGTALSLAQFPDRLAGLGFTAHAVTRDEFPVTYLLPSLVAVPAGPFLMGSDPKRDPVAATERWAEDEQPQYTVTLPAYDIGRFPVTVAEYACYIRDDHSEPSRCMFQDILVDWEMQLQRLDHPVVCVRWHGAVAYAAWLSELTGERFRLASEVEWEKAARGTDGRIYPWGDTFDTARCNTSESGINSTTPVGTYPAGASPYGAEDLTGNVWEWTASWYRPYPYALAEEGQEADVTDERVVRGGSWGRDAGLARAACRAFNHPGQCNVFKGFRVVRASS
jgi:formylglycine-generating enzyme required for sulfatase activity